jgi:hypothetical protein
MTIPLQGGTVREFAPNQDNAVALAIDANNVYWTTWGYQTSKVLKQAKSASSPTVLASDLTYAISIAVDETSIYVATGSPKLEEGNIIKMPLNGGPQTVLATGQGTPRSLVVDATSVYWLKEYPKGAVMRLTPK